MPTVATLTTFGLATLAILAVPGPSVAFVVARSIEHGRVGGLCSVLGIETGAALHVLAASTGLAALLATSPGAFTALRWAGAAYLVGLAMRQFRQLADRQFHGPASSAHSTRSVPNRWRLYRDGVLVDLLNPKTALFFIAFLPQFVDPARGPTEGQVGALGLCFLALALVCDGTYALAAGGLAARFGSSPRTTGILKITTGGVYLALAGVAAVG